MLNLLLAFHDPHDRRLRLVLPVRRHPLVRLLVLLLRLLELDLVDLDAILRVTEAQVHHELVARVDIFAARGFGEEAVLGAGEGLKGTLELVVRELGRVRKLFVGDRLAVGFFVKVEHYNGLEGRKDNLLGAFGEDGSHLAVR